MGKIRIFFHYRIIVRIKWNNTNEGLTAIFGMSITTLYVLAFCYYYQDYNYNYFIFLLYVRRPSGESCLTLTTSSKKKKKKKNEVEQKSFAFQKKLPLKI